MAIYGAIENGVVDARTIGPTQRSAMVNWLWVNGLRVMNDWTDDVIRACFLAASDKMNVRLAELEVEVLRTLREPDQIG